MEFSTYTFPSLRNDAPIVTANGDHQTLSLNDWNFRNHLAGLRLNWVRQGNDIVATSPPNKVGNDGVHPHPLLQASHFN